MKTITRNPITLAALCALAVFVAACGKSSTEPTISAKPLKPKEAASNLEQAFAAAPVEVKQTATVASEALKSADYEKAVEAVQAIKQQQNMTLEQGIAVHGAMVSMESRLMSAIAAGDPNAKRAYERLRQLNRN
jgi:hypothetical protein